MDNVERVCVIRRSNGGERWFVCVFSGLQAHLLFLFECLCLKLRCLYAGFLVHTVKLLGVISEESESSLIFFSLWKKNLVDESVLIKVPLLCRFIFIFIIFLIFFYFSTLPVLLGEPVLGAGKCYILYRCA